MFCSYELCNLVLDLEEVFKFHYNFFFLGGGKSIKVELVSLVDNGRRGKF